MSTTPRDPSALDPDEAGRREFSKARKGFAPNEVRAHMLTLADEIKRLQGIESKLSAKVDRLEERVSEHGSLDPGQVAKALGQETVRVIDAAREAADEIRSRAEEHSARLVKEAQERVSKMNDEAEALRESSARDADELLGSARSRADEMLSDAQRAADELTSEATADAATMRDKAAKVLAERTEAAESEASRIRESANDLKSAADEYAAGVRTDADDYGDRTRRDAEDAGARIRAESATAAEQRAAESGEAADREIDAARERGREMIREAKQAREKMLRDLAERRKLGRQQLEALRAGRERLLDAFESARTALDGATEQIVVSLPEARDAADAAARGVHEDIDAAVEELEAEIVNARQTDAESAGELSGEPIVDGDVALEDPTVSEASVVDDSDAQRGAGSGETPEDSPPQSLGDDSVADDELADDQIADEIAGDETDPAQDGETFEPAADDLAPQTGHLRLVASRSESEMARAAHSVDPDESDFGDDDDDDDDDGGDDDELHPTGDGGDVEQLFARLRSAQPDDSEESDDDDEVIEESVIIHAEVAVIDLIAVSDDGSEGEADSRDGDDAGSVAGDESDVDAESADQSLLDQRDDLLGDLEKAIGRRLKRVVTDQENAVLDRVRRDRKARTAAELLPGADEALAALVAAARSDLVKAVEAGAEFLRVTSSEGGVVADIPAILAEISGSLGEWIQAPLQSRLERAVEANDDTSHDRGELVNELRAIYREWRNDRLGELSGDLATLAFNRGILESASPSTSMCWVVDHGGLPCPDAEDNRLAGAIGVGEQYPTGDLCPPAHPGCRCLLVPASQ